MLWSYGGFVDSPPSPCEQGFVPGAANFSRVQSAKLGREKMKGDGRKYNIKPDFTSDKILQLKLFRLKVSRLEERTRGRFWGWKRSFLHN